MKIFLLIFTISTHDGQQPTVEKIEQPSMAACLEQADKTMNYLNGIACPNQKGWVPPEHEAQICVVSYFVRTTCVTGK